MSENGTHPLVLIYSLDSLGNANTLLCVGMWRQSALLLSVFHKKSKKMKPWVIDTGESETPALF